MKRFVTEHWTVFAFILVVLIGGLNAIGVRYTVLELPPFWGATLRFGPAAILLFVLSFLLKVPMLRGRALLGAVLFGFFNFGASYALIYYGFRKVPPGMGQVILALVPLFTLIFAISHRQERFAWKTLAGALVSLGGIVLVFRQEIQTNVPFFSLLALILAAASIAESGVIIKIFPRGNPIAVNAVGMSVATFLLFGMSLLFHEQMVLPVRAATWAAMIFLILFGSCIVFILVVSILKVWPASSTAYAFVLFPFVSLVASALLANETLSPLLAIGAVLVVGGAVIGILPQRRKRTLQQAPVAKLIK